MRSRDLSSRPKSPSPLSLSPSPATRKPRLSLRTRSSRRRRYLTLLILFLISWFLFHSTPTRFLNPFKSFLFSLATSGAPSVCLVGNAESTARALAVWTQWDQKFKSCFYIWGQEDNINNPKRKENEVIFLRGNLGFADGLWDAVKQVRKSWNCDYIFTHDDDLIFNLTSILPLSTSSSPESPPSLSSTLIKLLSIYRPAIAGFPWQVGDSRFDEMIQLKEKWGDKLVAPLTGFDNGMVIYHESVLDFFFPFAPRGEGGFNGQWTLGAHFLQLFGPLTFREHALRLNSFSYNNTLNLDNQPISWSSISIKNGTAYVPSSRHPYEYPMNDAYQSFLKSGLKDRDLPWGRHLTVDDVDDPGKGSRWGWSPDWILDRVSKFYEVRHEALSTNRLINQFEDKKLLELDPIKNEGEFKIKVIMFTQFRFKSFKRLWSSFERSNKIESEVEVEIIVDFDDEDRLKMEEKIEFNGFLAGLEDRTGLSPAKKVTVIRKRARVGLKKMILTSWNPKSNHEFVIFLEDDIEVSPYFLQYASSMIQSYVYRDKADHRLFGISLYNLHYNEAIESFVKVDTLNGHLPYIYQQAQSWGAIYLPEPWRQFLLYEKQVEKLNVDPIIPDSLTNRWPFQNSWKKTFMRYMVEKGGYFIYPNLPEGLSFSTNHVELGTNDMPNNELARLLIHEKFKVPLLESRDLQLPKNFGIFNPTPPLGELLTLDMRHHVLENPDEFLKGEDYVKSFDKCTMIMTVFSRTKTFMDRLEYYHTFNHLGQILVIWNNMEITPSQLVFTNYSIPVDILVMKKNSMNNRFYPWPQIKYSCIINMDDDWDMPFYQMDYAIRTWRGHFFNHLVGFSHQGRNHVVRDVNGVATTLYSPTFLSPQLLFDKTSFYSIVLPSGFIYHRKYLDVYTNKLPQAARDLVDRTMNCDDILFNYMMANETKSGPVVIEAWAMMLKSLGDDGLWARATHMSDRTECIRALNEIFGFNPLRYTTTMFRVQSATTVPGLHHHASQLKIPFDYPCNKTKFETENDCSMVMQQKYWNQVGGWV